MELAGKSKIIFSLLRTVFCFLHMVNYHLITEAIMNYNQYPLRAEAIISGNSFAPGLHGNVWFYDAPQGVRIKAKICCLPPSNTGFYGFHIHEVGDCALPNYEGAKGHFNPQNVFHPLHAGDFPMLMANYDMNAELSFVTSRFIVRDVLDRAVIIHGGRDDYSSQPSGDSGKRIGCGIIRAL